MSKASPVFKAMLSPHFAEGTKLRTTGSIELNLNEDDPVSMLIICRIAHLQNRFVPNSMSVSQLLDISEVCDKYDFREMLRTQAIQWITSALEELDDNEGRDVRGKREDLLMAAYGFGSATMFARCGEELITKEADRRFITRHSQKTAERREGLGKVSGMSTPWKRKIFLADLSQMLSLLSAGGCKSG